MKPPRNRTQGQRADARWLSLVKSLMVGVSPDDYVWSADPRVEAQRLVFEGRRHAVLQTVGAVAIVLATIVTMHFLGFRQVTPAQDRALAIVAQVDPDFEVDEDQVLALRWGQRADAYRLVRTASGASQTGQEYPFLATLSDHASPSISPGNGKAVVLLVAALDRYPEADAERLIDRLLALAASLDKPYVIDGLSAMATLAEPLRAQLFAVAPDGSSLFARVIAEQTQIDAAQGGVGNLEQALEIRRKALQAQRETLTITLQQVVLESQRADADARQCSKRLARYNSCIAGSLKSLP